MFTFHVSDCITHRKLDEIIGLLQSLKKEVHTMSQALDTAFEEMNVAVSAQTDAQQSAVLLLNRIAELIAEASAGGDAVTVAKLTALKNTIAANASDLAAAVVANTPAATPVV